MLTVGADPEFFVRKGSHFISGHIFECGTKREPQKTEHGYVQVDGIALECNVRPSATRDDFVSNVTGVLSDLDGIVRSRMADSTLVARPSIFFGHKRLQTLPKENAELGCSPDFNAYTLRRNPTPDREMPIRTGAGHIHLGWTKGENERSREHMGYCATIVRELDYWLGLPSLIWDKDKRRRKLYGKAGAFRPKPYGLEYRVLSNAWLTNTSRIGWVYDRSVAAYDAIQQGIGLAERYGEFAKQTIDWGDTSWPARNPELAELIL